MQRRVLLLFLLALAILGCASFFAFPSHSASRSSLSKSALLAIVAGDSLPENVVFEIHSRGLNFTPDDRYRSLLKDAGADPTVLAALDTAKVTGEALSAASEDSALLQTISSAGAKIRAGQLEDATRELAEALTGSSGTSAIGFVQGMVLIKLKRFGEAGQVYAEILSEDPDFPLLHTRLSLTYFQTGDAVDALREAKAALAENPNNPSACLNAGLALADFRKFDAAKSQLQLCIRIKPDYGLAYAGLASLLEDMKDFEGAIAQYKKALTLKPNDANTHYNLGTVYGHKGDYVSAIREYREAKRLDPARLEARQNLGIALIRTDPAAAILEFRALVAIAPNWPYCHGCLGDALYQTGKYEEAEKEYLAAAEADPAEPRSHTGLGHIYEVREKYDEALLEYRIAEKLDDTSGAAFTDAGRVLLLKKDFPAAITELQRAEEVDPANWVNHDLRGQAFEGSGDADAAIAEYKEALSIAPKELQARLDLALALEKKGDWVSALDNYRQASLDEPPIKLGLPQPRFDAQNKYESAQKRFSQHLASLRSSGRTSEAAKVQASLRSRASTANLDEKFHAAMQASVKAVNEKRFEDAETSAKQAVDIAGKTQPLDGRLPEALGQLGSVYAWRVDYKNAHDVYKQQLAQSEKIYGPKSPQITPALENLGLLALSQKDFATSEALFSRALDLNQSTYGENSSAVAESLRALAHVYSVQKDVAKSEAALLRVVHIYRIMYAEDDYNMGVPYTSLCYLYDQWGKPDKSAPCFAHLVSLIEKQFGANSPYLVRDLTAEVKALRQLGHNEEADKIQHRLDTLQANPN